MNFLNDITLINGHRLISGDKNELMRFVKIIKSYVKTISSDALARERSILDNEYRIWNDKFKYLQSQKNQNTSYVVVSIKFPQKGAK